VQRQPSQISNYRKQWLVAKGTAIVLRVRSAAIKYQTPTQLRTHRSVSKTHCQQAAALSTAMCMEAQQKTCHYAPPTSSARPALRRSSKSYSLLNPCSRTRRRYIATGRNSNLRRPYHLTAYRGLSFDAVCIKLCSSKSVI
jgi:hypothetical protein